MTRRGRFVLRALIPITIAFCAVAAQEVPRTAVTSHLVVTSPERTPFSPIDVTRLTARSNGIDVPIVRVTNAPPLSLVVLIDVTSSVSEAMASFIWDGRGKQDDVRPSGVKPPDSPSDLFLRPLLRGLLRNVRPDDRIRFGRITNVAELDSGFTSDRSALERTARWVVDPPSEQRHGNTPLWDAVDMALSALETEAGRRRAILLVTDGLSTGNRFSLESVVDRAAYSDVAVFVVGEAWGVPRSGRGWNLRDSTDGPWFMIKGAFTSPFDQLQRLTRATGGIFLPDGAGGRPDPETRLATTMNLLRVSYAVTIASPLLPGESGTFAIVTDQPGVEIHVRDRYRR